MNALYGVTSLLPILSLLRFIFLASLALYVHRQFLFIRLIGLDTISNFGQVQENSSLLR